MKKETINKAIKILLPICAIAIIGYCKMESRKQREEKFQKEAKEIVDQLFEKNRANTQKERKKQGREADEDEGEEKRQIWGCGR